MTPVNPGVPARRHRHACRIAALALLMGSAAKAASTVYRQVAAAPPGQADVEVTLLPLHQVNLAAVTTGLDRARAEDAARWPAAVQWEAEESRRTYDVRYVAARAQEIVDQVDPPVGPYAVPPLTAEQVARGDLITAVDEVALLWKSDPEEAIARVHEMAADGDLAAVEILDEAAASAERCALSAMRQACVAASASEAAALCLAAVTHAVLGVSMLSTDP
ncbi:hypothetical protein ACFYS8_13515 [Kitasatospora sp. NPDC004615]|uniref:hypothetical protein n=1 Tax=Kitasatospora sp. NPDC004615 TaxID=3364017 RepID=UPI003693F609